MSDPNRLPPGAYNLPPDVSLNDVDPEYKYAGHDCGEPDRDLRIVVQFCAKCSGDGYLTEERRDSHGYPYTYVWKCSSCNGRGVK